MNTVVDTKNEAKKIGENEQVYIGLDGPDGVVIQTTMATYEGYYKLLGYRLIGKAVKLPRFEKMGGGSSICLNQM